MTLSDRNNWGKLWYLSISSFAGIVPGASHFQGRLRGRGREIGLEHPMSTKERIIANRREGWTVFTEGDTTAAFETREELITVALQTWRDTAPNGDILILGDPVYCDPQEPLAGPEDFLSEARKIFDEFESVDGFGSSRRAHNDPREIIANRCCKEWDLLVARFKEGARQ